MTAGIHFAPTTSGNTLAIALAVAAGVVWLWLLWQARKRDSNREDQ